MTLLTFAIAIGLWLLAGIIAIKMGNILSNPDERIQFGVDRETDRGLWFLVFIGPVGIPLLLFFYAKYKLKEMNFRDSKLKKFLDAVGKKFVVILNRVIG